jgi:hypothetical protein
MANGRNMKASKKGGKSINEPFAVVPKSALFSDAFLALNKVERALLFEFMAQYTGKNNGRLLCSVKKLKSRGYTSSDTLFRAKKVLLIAGFIFETVKGHRPNWASWYALTWRPLDYDDRYDAGVAAAFREAGQSAYLKASIDEIHTTRELLRKKKLFIPAEGHEDFNTVPSNGFIAEFLIPSRGTVDNRIH